MVEVVDNAVSKEDRAERIAQAEAEVKRLESASSVADGDDDRAIPNLSSTSNDSTSDEEEGLVDSDASGSDASSINVGQEALRNAPEKDDEEASALPASLSKQSDTKTEEIDEANIAKAKFFLTHPNTVSLPMEEKRKYLLAKGLNESEIKASVAAVAEGLILEQGLLYDDMGTETKLDASPNVNNDELKPKDAADTESNASTADKSSLDVPRGDAADDAFDAKTKANKSALNTSILSQKLTKSLDKMKQVDVKLPSCGCLPSHLPNRVVIGLVLFAIFLAAGLYLIYTFAVGGLQ